MNTNVSIVLYHSVPANALFDAILASLLPYHNFNSIYFSSATLLFHYNVSKSRQWIVILFELPILDELVYPMSVINRDVRKSAFKFPVGD